MQHVILLFNEIASENQHPSGPISSHSYTLLLSLLDQQQPRRGLGTEMRGSILPITYLSKRNLCFSHLIGGKS